MGYDDTKFFAVAKNYGVLRIVKSKDLIYALFLSIVFTLIIGFFGLQIEINETVCPIYVTISATMIAVAIAGLAIVVSMSDSAFIKILKSANIYENILFSFYYSSIISGTSIILCTMAYVFSIFNKYYFSGNNSCTLALIFLFASTFFVLYSVFSTILLVGLTMRYGFYRGYFIDK